MAVSSLKAFDVGPLFKELDDIVREAKSPAERKKAFVDFTRSEIAKADADNRAILGGEIRKTVAVNGVVGAPIESVRLNGTVRAEWHLMEEVIRWIGAELLQASPVLTGQYRRSHLFFADGVRHDPDGTIPDANEWVFANEVPYARKIEGNKEAGIPPQSRQAPNGVYLAIAAIAKQRFGNLARISYTFFSVDGTREGRNPAILIRYPRGA